MPTPWFYTRDDDMAELLLAYNALPPGLKEKALSYLRELVATNGAEDGADRADGAGQQSHPTSSVTYSQSSLGQNQSRTPVPPPAPDEQSRK
jgi:hypothetical protein